MSKCQQASQLIDKPIDKVANVQYQIGDNHQGTHLIQVEVTSPNQACVPVQEQISLGDALTNKLDPLCESSIATSGLSVFDSDALLISPSFGS